MTPAPPGRVSAPGYMEMVARNAHSRGGPQRLLHMAGEAATPVTSRWIVRTSREIVCALCANPRWDSNTNYECMLSLITTHIVVISTRLSMLKKIINIGLFVNF